MVSHRSARSSRRVQAVNHMAIAFVNDTPLYFQGRRQLAALHRKVFVQDLKALDCLKTGQVGVHLADHLLQITPHSGIARQGPGAGLHHPPQSLRIHP